LPAAVLNDEATVTDTLDATPTGSASMIPVRRVVNGTGLDPGGGNKPQGIQGPIGEWTVNGTNLVDYAKVVDLSSINITTQVPLAANTFFTLQLLQELLCLCRIRKGLTLLYSTANGVWIEEQYIGTTISTWLQHQTGKSLINELNNFSITKAPTVTFTGRNVIFDACFRD
jgi:hypothetical protein